MEATEHTISPEQAGQRLDVWAVSKLPELSRSAIQKAIKSGEIRVNGAESKPRYTVHAGDVVVIPQINVSAPAEPREVPDIAIPIIFENKDMLVIEKPAGITVHEGQKTGPTITAWLVKKYPKIIDVGDPGRPGIVHRLDKETSGVMVIAKTQPAYEHLKLQFKRHRARKQYLALVYGVLGSDNGRIVRPIARSRRNPMRRVVDPQGKEAITEWKKDRSIQDKYTLIKVFILTGRTHQIRVHMHWLGFPIVGDKLYVFKRQKTPAGVTRQLLHAERLTLTTLQGVKKTFIASIPEDFATVLESMENSQ